jgi:transcriptional repressor NrdR
VARQQTSRPTRSARPHPRRSYHALDHAEAAGTAFGTRAHHRAFTRGRHRFRGIRGQRFTTVERVQLRDLTVVKNDGRRVPFDRDKLARSIRISLRKRPIQEERIERIVNPVVRQLEASGESDVPSEQIGELVMDTLKEPDKVAYVRFASVYRDFREAKDFEDFVGTLSGDP